MALTYVGGTNGNGANSNYTVSLTSLSGGIGSSPQAGDIVIVISSVVQGETGHSDVISSGYTLLSELYSEDSFGCNTSAHYKIMGSTPDTEVVIQASGNASYGSSCVIQVWRGVDQTTPIDVTTVNATGTNSCKINSGSITPITSGAVVLTAGGCASASGRTVSVTPTGYSNKVEKTYDPGFAGTAVIASKSWISGAENPSIWEFNTTTSDDAWCAFTIVLRPSTVIPTNFQINIGDSWKTVESIQINIGDSWKEVTNAQINIGDTWKTIY